MIGEANGRRFTWILVGVLILTSIAFFASFVFDRGEMLFGTDMLSQAYQSRAFAVQEVQAGRGLPQWNPFVYGGMPYLSILPYPVYYPTSLLYFVAPLHRAIGWAFVLHFMLAGVLAYGLARELGLSRGPAIVTGAAYMFTGYLVSHLYAGQDGRMFAMTWSPALFLLAERAISRQRLHWWLWLALVAALQVFTPHVQMMYFAAMAVSAYVAFRLVQIRRAGATGSSVAMLTVGFAGAYALAGLVTLVEVWPTLNMVQFSHRAAREYAYAASWSMPVQETLATIWPGLQGHLATYWGTNPFKLHTEYLGAVPVLLALLALLVRRTPRVWFFFGMGVVALFFAWGAATPVHRLAYEALPLMKSFRAPAMMFSIVAVAVAVLAGHGAQVLYDKQGASRRSGHPAWKVLGALAAVWILVWFWLTAAPDGFARFWADLLYGSPGPERVAAARQALPAFTTQLGVFALAWSAGLAICMVVVRGRVLPLTACLFLAVVTVADLWRVGRDFYDTVPVSQVTAGDGATRYLAAQEGPYRALPLPNAYGPNDLMIQRIETVTGSQNFRLQWWDDLVGTDMSRLSNPRILRLLNVHYVVSGEALDIDALHEVHGAPGPRVYAWNETPQAAWFVRRTVVLPDYDEPGLAVLDNRFDPGRSALLDAGTIPPVLGAVGEGGSVRWVERVPDRIALDVETPGDALLVISEIYHPYWRATVDGEPADVLKVDVALRGVVVPAGSHRVSMTFADPYVRRGRLGSVVGVVLLVSLLGATWRRRDSAA